MSNVVGYDERKCNIFWIPWNTLYRKHKLGFPKGRLLIFFILFFFCYDNTKTKKKTQLLSLRVLLNNNLQNKNCIMSFLYHNQGML